jgi:hypothetical protein
LIRLPAARVLVLTLLTLAAGLSAVPSSSSATRSSEGPTWVPLRGEFRVARTWGHAGGHGYPAIDFQIPSGRSVRVYAAGPGTVIAAEGGCPDSTAEGAHTDCNGSQGNLVDIVHADGRRSRYLHLRYASVTVGPGEYVCRGCLIGRTGWSGNVSPPGPDGGHLHYEELRGFKLVSPGPMHAEQRTGRVTYPGPGQNWREAGREHLAIENHGFPAPGPAPTASCHGWMATRVGTAGADQIRGTVGPDIIVGGAGNDTIRGIDGDDKLCGASGDDVLVGGPHWDDLDGGDGTDTCFQDEEDGYQTAGQGTLVSCESPPYDLTIEVRCCLRFVTSQPSGISCPPDCSESYPVQTQVTLTLSGPGASGNAAWSGCDTQTSGSVCIVTMTSDRRVTV